MDQDFNNSQNEFLWALLANPAADVRLYSYNLQRLVNDFPQSGILHALLAHASDEKNLRQASVYFNARSLYKLINAPSTFTGVPNDKIIIQTGTRANGHYQPDEHLQTEENLFAQPGENVDDTVIDSFVDDHLVVETEQETVTRPDDHQPAIADEEDLLPANPLADEYHTQEAVPEISESETNEQPEENIVNEAHEATSADAVPAPPEPELIHNAAAGHEEIQEAVEDKAANIHEAVSQETILPHKEPELIHDPVAENIEPGEAVENNAEEIHEVTPQEALPSPREPELIQHAVAEEVDPVEPVEDNAAEIQEVTPQESLPSHGGPELIQHAVAEEVEPVEPVEDNAGEIQEVTPAEATSRPEAELVHHAVAEEIEPEEAVEDKASELHETVSPEESLPHQEPELNHHTIAEKEEYDERVDISPAANAEVAVEEPGALETTEQEPEKSIDEETFDEIVGIENISTASETNQAAEVNEEAEAAGKETAPVADDELEKLIPESIASTDFFMFDKAFGEHKQVDQNDNKVQVASGDGSETTGVQNADHQDVSKYHDEKMPYTFMWWLDKTRKEHAGPYQPYVKPEAADLSSQPKRAADELQQQYFENIFHITSVDELDKNAPPLTAPYNPKRKEHVIIERFIKEEPQIKPQSSDKIDNENKAKKSSEDRDELVTETLAIIYADQMLYHKAIASYKKLMLKFPEKSRYFAGKIEQLEKKTN